jgi:hypothetical protein
VFFHQQRSPISDALAISLSELPSCLTTAITAFSTPALKPFDFITLERSGEQFTLSLHWYDGYRLDVRNDQSCEFHISLFDPVSFSLSKPLPEFVARLLARAL